MDRAAADAAMIERIREATRSGRPAVSGEFPKQ
jgi:hypothetical protein